MSPEFLTVAGVESIHAEQLSLHGGSAGVRDRGALESAVATAQATFGGEFLHADIFEMATAYQVAQVGADEFSSDDEPLSWESDGWENVG